MTEPTLPERDFSRTFSGFREAVRGHATPPPAAAIRGRAEHQVRVRRTTAALVAAAAVAIVAVGGGAVLRDDALPGPLPPGETGTPTPDPSASASPRPPKSLPPPRTNPVTDPIAKVNWLTTMIDIPRETGCPIGDVRFRPVPDDPTNAWSGAAFPRIFLRGATVAYGDLVGDGRPEAVMEFGCLAGPEDSGDGSGRLLVVTREPGGKLRGVAWVGQPGAIYNGLWVDQQRLYVDTTPWHTDWGYSLGEARAYAWRGNRSAEVDVRATYPGLIPARGRPGTPVDLSPVAQRLRCAAGQPVPAGSALAAMRFDADWRAIVDGVTWSARQPLGPDELPHLLDLDGDGRRRLLVSLSCGEIGDKAGTPNIVLLERAGGTYRAIDVVIPPAPVTNQDYFRWTSSGRELILSYIEPLLELRYVWNGEYFQR
ncbi:MAG TPA: hypothetical protein VFR67_16700 [Pilimelia sp.]|nr:hypothetical protein [Pilimelia sp.]